MFRKTEIHKVLTFLVLIAIVKLIAHVTKSYTDQNLSILGRGKSTEKEDGLGCSVHYKEEERMVCHKLWASMASSS